MKKIILFSSLILTLFISYSCQKSDEIVDINNQNSRTKENFDMDLYQKYKSNFDDNSIISDYKVIDGIIHFKNQETFRKSLNDLVNLRKNLDNQGFISSEKYLKNLFKQMSNPKGRIDVEKIIDNNRDYLTFENQRVQIVAGMKITPFTDKNGMFYIGKVLFMLGEKEQYIIYDGDLKKTNTLKVGVAQSEDVQKLSMNINSKAKINSCSNLFEFVSNGDFASSVYVGGGFLIIPTGNGDFNASGYAFSLGNYIDLSNGGFTYVSGNNELKVNYRAKIEIFGTEVNNTEPNETINNSDIGISDFRTFGFRTVTQQEIDNTNGNIFVLFDERGGYYKNLNTGSQANMKCN